MSDDDWFDDPELLLKLRKPSTWEFMPVAWATGIRKRLRSGSTVRAIVETASDPVVYAQFDHGRDDAAYPTLQVNVNMNRRSRSRVQRLVDLANTLNLAAGFDIEDASADALFGGQVGVMLSGRMVLENAAGDRFPSWVTTWQVVRRGLVYSVGLSGPEPELLDWREDFELVRDSVRIG